MRLHISLTDVHMSLSMYLDLKGIALISAHPDGLLTMEWIASMDVSAFVLCKCARESRGHVRGQSPLKSSKGTANQSVFVPDTKSAIGKAQIKPCSAQKVRPRHGPPEPHHSNSTLSFSSPYLGGLRHQLGSCPAGIQASPGH